MVLVFIFRLFSSFSLDTKLNPNCHSLSENIKVHRPLNASQKVWAVLAKPSAASGRGQKVHEIRKLHFSLARMEGQTYIQPESITDSLRNFHIFPIDTLCCFSGNAPVPKSIHSFRWEGECLAIARELTPLEANALGARAADFGAR